MDGPLARMVSAQNAEAIFRSLLSRLVSEGRAEGWSDEDLRERAIKALRRSLRRLDAPERDLELFASIVRRVVDEVLPEGATP